MRYRIIAGVSIALLLVSSLPVAAQTLTDAFNAFSAHKIQSALELFEKVCADKSIEPKDRVRAAVATAVLNWRYYGLYDEGRQFLQKALALGVKTSGTLADLARLERNAGRYAESLDAASRSCLLADSPQEAINARIAYAISVVQPHADAAQGFIDEVPEAVRDKLPLAHDILRTLVASEPGELQSSSLLLLSGILVGDGASALEGWRSYYRIAEGVSAGKILDDAGAQLSEHLADWKGADSPIEQSIAVARALAASRMYGPASLLIELYIPEDQRPDDISDVFNYGLFTHKLTELTDEYYRETAIGESDYSVYFSSLLTMVKGVWESGHWANEPFPIAPPFTEENVSSQRDAIDVVRKRLLENFGAYIALGKTAGYPDLHYGHVVVDDNRTIDQYGHKAEIRFLLLDNMVSNGFQSWAWDYRSQHGGWANEIGIFQVRPAYTGGPMQTWRRLSDPKQLEEWLESIDREKEDDAKRAAGNAIVYLPSVRGQLQYTAQLQLLNRLKAEGLSSSELQTRFIAELTRITQEYSIFAHEGRHYIDKGEGIDSSEELEFRAKLSEIAFSELPKMALAGAIFSSNIGSATPHGQANKRVMQGIVDWMNAHAKEIEGLDSSTPMLLQLNKLTDDQLRAAVRSIDPLAQEGAKSGSH